MLCGAVFKESSFVHKIKRVPFFILPQRSLPQKFDCKTPYSRHWVFCSVFSHSIMAEFKLKNLGFHTTQKLTSSINLGNRITQLGETLKYARQSLSQLTVSPLTAPNPVSPVSPSKEEQPSILETPAPDQAIGKLTVNIVEARNLNIVNAKSARPYCLLQCDKNEFSTSDGSGTLTSAQGSQAQSLAIPIPNAKASKPDPFQMAMQASCPKWQYEVVL